MTDEYIKREDALKAPEWTWAGKAAFDIKAIPAEDIAPVRHGRWIWDGDFFDEPWNRKHKCSECNKSAPYNAKGKQILSDYCPNCGAKMGGEK